MRFDELLQALDETFQFCNDLGLAETLQHSRFVQYQDYLSALVKLIASRRPGESLPAEVHEALRKNHLEYVISLTESFELVLTLPYLKAIGAGIVRQKLRKALSGPFFPTDEDQNSNESRNTVFELNLAAKLAAAGLEPKLGTHADIEVVLLEKQLVIECKRPFSVRGLPRNIKDARD